MKHTAYNRKNQPPAWAVQRWHDRSQSNQKTIRFFGLDNSTGVCEGKISVHEKQTEIPGLATKQREHLVGKKRGVIKELSFKSKTALRNRVHSIQPAVIRRRSNSVLRWEYPGAFITLTYPRKFECDGMICKEHLHWWLLKVQRKWPKAWAIWVMELQQRGAWHFHLLIRWPMPLLGEGGWRARQLWVSKSWAECVAGFGNQVDKDHLAAGTRIDKLITVAAVVNYISKSGSKVAQKQMRGKKVGTNLAGEMSKNRQKESKKSYQGRWWGIHNRKEFDKCASIIEIELPWQTAKLLEDAVAEFWIKKYKELGYDEPPHLPKWVDGYEASRIFKGVDPEGIIRTLPAVDVVTGESIKSIDDLCVKDFGKAAAA